MSATPPRKNDGWSALLVFASLGALLMGLITSRILLRYRFDGGWVNMLVYSLCGALFCTGLAFIIKQRHRTAAGWASLTKLETLACMAAWLPLVLVSLIYLPLIRKPLTIRDHRLVTGPDYDNAYHGGLGLALPEHYFQPQWGPLLVRDEGVIANRLSHFDSFYDIPDANAFIYAALRLQGWTPERIAGHPHGAEMFLAALEAEDQTPEWWPQMPWLTQPLDLQPEGSLHLGLLKKADAQTQVMTLGQRFGELDSSSQSKLVRQMAQAHLDLLTQPQLDELLDKWAIAARKRIYVQERLELADALNGRKQLRALAAAAAGPDGTLPVSLKFPDYFTEELRRAYQDTMYDLLASCGYWPVPGDKLRLELKIEPRRFAQVALDDEVQETRPETRTRTIRSGNRTRTVSETVNRTRTVTKTSTEAAEVPTLVINASAGSGSLTLSAAPYRSVSRTANAAANLLLRQPRPAPDGKTANYLRDVPSGPWRLGL